MRLLRWFAAQLTRLARAMGFADRHPVAATTATFLRGLRQSTHLKKSSQEVTAAAFEPPDNTLARRKKDGFEPAGHESSINWEDEEGALTNLRSNVNAKYGVVRVRHDVISKQVEAMPEYQGRFVCERRPIETENPYHGNIVFCEGLEKHERLKLCTYLAFEAKLVP